MHRSLRISRQLTVKLPSLTGCCSDVPGRTAAHHQDSQRSPPCTQWHTAETVKCRTAIAEYSETDATLRISEIMAIQGNEQLTVQDPHGKVEQEEREAVHGRGTRNS